MENKMNCQSMKYSIIILKPNLLRIFLLYQLLDSLEKTPRLQKNNFDMLLRLKILNYLTNT